MVKGAVLGGLGIGRAAPTKMMRCPRNYGICLSRGYKEWRDESRDVVQHRFTKEAFVEGQAIWLIRRDDVILPDAPITVQYLFHFSISKSQQREAIVLKARFVASPVEDAPSKVSDISRGMSRPALITHDAYANAHLFVQANSNSSTLT